MALVWVGGEGLSLRPSSARGGGSSTADVAPSDGFVEPARAVGLHPDNNALLQDQDRLFGRIAAVRADLEQVQLSAAITGLEELRRDAIAAASGAQLAILDQEVEDVLHAMLLELAGRVEAGWAPEAAKLVARLATDIHPRVDRALRELTRARSWPRLHDIALPGEPVHATSTALATGRRVRLLWNDEWVEGVIVGAEQPEGVVTARVETASGVFFPAVARASVAPVDPDPAELRAQLAAALAARNAGLASAWLATCLARGLAIESEMRDLLAAWFVNDRGLR